MVLSPWIPQQPVVLPRTVPQFALATTTAESTMNTRLYTGSFITQLNSLP